MKICIIGNSHSICLNKAWRKTYKDYSNVSISFFAAAGNYFNQISVNESNDALVVGKSVLRERIAASSGGDGGIRLDGFDLCLIVGGFDQAAACEIGALGGEKEMGFSMQVATAAANDIYDKTDVSSLLLKIRKVSDISVQLIHNPFIAPIDPVGQRSPASKYNAFNYSAGVDFINEQIFYPLQIELLKQPSETIVLQCFTKREFANGPRKAKQSEIDAGNDSGIVDDKLHMNGEYGMLRLRRLLDKF